ncbi:hypothetical protein Tco_0840318 [Tanacetum coccineum]|uniref:Uncharacterized protein n=1 Tax=Tanacetum coccineum TaxID=301880 RepID=A0ABQ5AT73_9ASTR
MATPMAEGATSFMPKKIQVTQRLLKMVDGLNFKDFVIFLSAFNPKATMPQKIERHLFKGQSRTGYSERFNPVVG